MTFLFLEQNKIGDEGVSSLCTSLHNLEKLHLRNCSVTNLGVQNLSRAITQKTISVRKL